MATLAVPPANDEFSTQVANLVPGDIKQVETMKQAVSVFKEIAQGTFPSQEKWHITATLRAQHPRLIATDKDLLSVKNSIKRDPVAKKLFDTLQSKAAAMLTEAPAKFQSGNEESLVQSRAAFKRITTLAGIYRLTQDHRYFERARQEMLAVSALPNWYPEHFLTVAEMLTGLSIGYDWLYNELSADDRQTIKNAIVKNGLRPGLDQT